MFLLPMSTFDVYANNSSKSLARTRTALTWTTKRTRGTSRWSRIEDKERVRRVLCHLCRFGDRVLERSLSTPATARTRARHCSTCCRRRPVVAALAAGTGAHTAIAARAWRAVACAITASAATRAGRLRMGRGAHRHSSRRDRHTARACVVSTAQARAPRLVVAGLATVSARWHVAAHGSILDKPWASRAKTWPLASVKFAARVWVVWCEPRLQTQPRTRILGSTRRGKGRISRCLTGERPGALARSRDF